MELEKKTGAENILTSSRAAREAGEGPSWTTLCPLTHRRQNVEVLSKSCTDLKRCGTRAELKLQLEKCASSLSPIHERNEKEESGEDEGHDSKQSRPSSPNLISFENDPLQPTRAPGGDRQGPTLDLGPFQGDLEIALRSEGRVACLALKQSPNPTRALITTTTLTPQLAMLNQYELQLDTARVRPLVETELPVLRSAWTQTVREEERGSQVGQSLACLVSSESEEFLPTAMEPINEGFMYSIRAFQRLFIPESSHEIQEPNEINENISGLPISADFTKKPSEKDVACQCSTIDGSLTHIDELLLLAD